jgi:hypothetical protein
VEAVFLGRLGRPIWFNTFWKARSQWSYGSYSVIIAPKSIHLKESTLFQAEDRQGNLFACALQWFTFRKVQSMLCSAFTGSRSKAIAARTSPRASPDTRTRLTIWIWTRIKRVRKRVLFEYFHHSYRDAHPYDLPEIRKQEIRSEKWLILIIWGSTGIKSLLYIPKWTKYNITFFVESVVPDLVERVYQESRRKTPRGTMNHMDDARPHNGRKMRQLLLQQKASNPCPSLQSRSISEWL